jgi:hypothetical protein
MIKQLKQKENQIALDGRRKWQLIRRSLRLFLPGKANLNVGMPTKIRPTNTAD